MYERPAKLQKIKVFKATYFAILCSESLIKEVCIRFRPAVLQALGLQRFKVHTWKDLTHNDSHGSMVCLEFLVLYGTSKNPILHHRPVKRAVWILSIVSGLNKVYENYNGHSALLVFLI